MNRHRIGMIGLGAASIPHAQSFLDLGDRVEVAAAYSPTEARRKAFAEKFPFPLVETPGAIFGDGTIDAVAILTPPNTHLELVRSAARAGKHILLEKPIDTTSERAAEIIRTCRNSSVRLAVSLQHRFRPSAMNLLEALRSGILGRVLTCSCSIRLWRPQEYYDEAGRGTRKRDGGGVLLTQAIHTLDLMTNFAGPASEVKGYATTTFMHKMETEDLVVAALKFANGAFGTIEATTAAYPGYPERIELACERGSATLKGHSLTIVRNDRQVVEMKTDVSNDALLARQPHDDHKALIADFLDAIDEKRDPLASGMELLRAHRLIEALLETAATGRPIAVKQ